MSFIFRPFAGVQLSIQTASISIIYTRLLEPLEPSPVRYLPLTIQFFLSSFIYLTAISHPDLLFYSRVFFCFPRSIANGASGHNGMANLGVSPHLRGLGCCRRVTLITLEKITNSEVSSSATCMVDFPVLVKTEV
jgi:hypothetical protein